MTLTSLLVTIIGLIILWIIVSIPVWLAGKAVTGGKATFGDAMIATLFGPIVYAITIFVVGYFLGAAIGSSAYIIALILALIAWIWVYKASFRTSWLGGIAIAILGMDNLRRNKHNIRSPLPCSSSWNIFPPHLKTNTKQTAHRGHKRRRQTKESDSGCLVRPEFFNIAFGYGSRSVAGGLQLHKFNSSLSLYSFIVEL